MDTADKPTAPPAAALSVKRIAAAYEVIDRPFRDSPQFEAVSLGRHFGCRIVAKIETLNPIRSFKARGAQYFIAQQTDDTPLVCASAGNFGQGMAYAARQRNIPLTVFTNVDASAVKLARMASLGARIVTVGTGPDDALAAAARFARETGSRLVEDGREPAISEGAGTIGLELLRDPERLDTIVVPLGDGGLLSGVGCWVKAHSPTTRVVGVCAAGAPAMQVAWQGTRRASSPPCSTIADALAIQTPFPESLARLRGYADDILAVEDETLIRAMRLACEELGLLLEPGGAAAVAALLVHTASFRDRRSAIVLTGGNLTRQQIQRWIASAPPVASGAG